MAEMQATGALLGFNEPAQRQLGNLQADGSGMILGFP